MSHIKAKHWHRDAIIFAMFLRFLLSFIVLLLLSACTSKTITYIEKVTLLGNSKAQVNNPTLQKIANILQADTNATLLYVNRHTPHTKSPFIVFVTDKYLKILFNTSHMFAEEETTINDWLKAQLQLLIPTLHKYPNIVIQIIGHAYEEGNTQKLRHYADLRAINAAAYLYEAGLKQEILAKGCSDVVPKQKCNPEKPHSLCSMQNRRIEIFLYSDKADVITKCK